MSRGTVISVPIGLPMPPGSVRGPAYPVGGNSPTTSLYVCQHGRWIGILSYRESAIELHSDAVSVVAVEGSPVVVTVRSAYAGETAITLSASMGSVEVDGDGGWIWQHAPHPVHEGEVVVITATADDNTSKVAFELTYPERRRD